MWQLYRQLKHETSAVAALLREAVNLGTPLTPLYSPDLRMLLPAESLGAGWGSPTPFHSASDGGGGKHMQLLGLKTVGPSVSEIQILQPFPAHKSRLGLAAANWPCSFTVENRILLLCVCNPPCSAPQE